MTDEKVSGILEYLVQFALTKAEKLQIVNLLPRSPVDFYLVALPGGIRMLSALPV